MTDPSGAIVPGATVTSDRYIHEPHLHGHDVGLWVFTPSTRLPPNQFTLTVTATGFKKKTLNNVKILPEQANAVNVHWLWVRQRKQSP